MTERILKVDLLNVEVHGGRREMGSAAASHVEKLVLDILEHQKTVRMIFAAAPSQDEFLTAFTSLRRIPWERIVGLHMDEYVGLEPSDARTFGAYLRTHIFSKVPIGEVHLIGTGSGDPELTSRRYSEILASAPVDIVCMGIGENGHIAFNDPPVADFSDPSMVKVVELDRACRFQQVNDGCFPSFADVPTHAMTLTVPALMSARHLSIVVPGGRKARAVAASLHGPIATAVPASILRTHRNARLFLDTQSAELLDT